MKTFALQNGDLALGRGGYQMKDGSAKLRQDLGNTMSEPFGIDRFHPRWGSLLDDFVGTPVGGHTDLQVKSEISRLVQNYITVQNEQMQRDATAGRKPRYSPGEVVANIANIEVRQEYDRYFVKVTLNTLSREQITLVQAVET